MKTQEIQALVVGNAYILSKFALSVKTQLMKPILLVTASILILFFFSCNDRTIHDLEVASGYVAGNEWAFEQGRASFGTSEIEIILMDSSENISDPCGTLNPSTPYVKFTIPYATGTYFIPFENDSKSVKFHEGAASAVTFSATSGYVQVTDINSFAVEGIIIANFDDDNDIAGAFFVNPCN